MKDQRVRENERCTQRRAISEPYHEIYSIVNVVLFFSSTPFLSDSKELCLYIMMYRIIEIYLWEVHIYTHSEFDTVRLWLNKILIRISFI